MNTPTPSRGTPDPFEVDPLTHALSGFVERHRAFVVRASRWETRAYREELAERRIDRPVFITGLARSGTTILLEFAAGLSGVATHRYRDFSLLHTPIWWNGFLDRTPRRESAPVERSHQDGIAVTPESPEAMEEPLWMTWFPRSHDPAVSQVLGARDGNADFEAFFRDHLRKILFLRQGRRYVSKNNYNLTRMQYLLHLFSDAKFVIPIREPVGHLASIMRQQKLFAEGERRQPKAIDHLRRVGHFEFGLDRRPINPGAAERIREIAALWAAGLEVRGWARYWKLMADFVAKQLRADPALRKAAVCVPFERFCENPAEVLTRLCEHCEFDGASARIAEFAARVRVPNYYTHGFTDADLAVIREETGGVEWPAALSV